MIQLDSELLTVEEAAKVLRISQVTLRRLLRESKLPGVKVGNVWRIPRSALEAFLAGPSSGQTEAKA